MRQTCSIQIITHTGALPSNAAPLPVKRALLNFMRPVLCSHTHWQLRRCQ